MPEQDGLKVGIAFEAVRQCHQDVGRLIADFDGYMTKARWTRLWTQDAVTWGVSRAAYSPYWMAKMIYRMYQNEDAFPGVVEGFNIRFFSDDRSLKEPRLVVGRAKYDVPPNKTVTKVAQTWDFDEGFGKWCNAQPEDLGKVLSCDNKERNVERMLVIGVNLYSIQRLDDVTDKMQQIRHQFEAQDE